MTQHTSHSHRIAAGWDLFDKAREIIPFGTGTHSKAGQLRDAEPAYIQRGKGCRVWDIDGNEYIDYRNGLGPVTLGYCYEPVDNAIRQQLENGMVFSHPHPLEYELARELTEAIPAAQSVRFLKTGGEAMAAAVKFARAYSEKELVISSGYHGWLMMVHGQRGVPQAIGDLHFTFDYGDISSLRNLLTQHRGRVAAITLSASYSQLSENDPFPRQLREIADEFGVLLIIDEIVTGFRLRIGGFHEYYGIKPDLCVFSKGMANGMPISAIVGRKDVMATATQGATVSSTFSGDSLALAAAVRTVQIYRQEPVIDHLWKMGTMLSNGLTRIFKDNHIPLKLCGLAPCPMLSATTGNADSDRQLIRSFMRGSYLNGISLYLVPYVNYSHTPGDIEDTLSRLDFVCRNINQYEDDISPEQTSGNLLGVAAFTSRPK